MCFRMRSPELVGEVVFAPGVGKARLTSPRFHGSKWKWGFRVTRGGLPKEEASQHAASSPNPDKSWLQTCTCAWAVLHDVAQVGSIEQEVIAKKRESSWRLNLRRHYVSAYYYVSVPAARPPSLPCIPHSQHFSG